MNKKFVNLIAAAVLYACFCVYLYQPHFKNFQNLQWLLIVNSFLACLGCFVLSRRWVGLFAASFFAGAVYGCGPFLLGLSKYHPTAGFLAACIPWLFLPATFAFKNHLKWLRIPLAVLPFLAIIAFFQLAAHFRLFAVPVQTKMHLADMVLSLAPMAAAKKGLVLAGFYHVPTAALVLGLAMLFAARRYSVMLILITAAVLAFCDSFLKVSPIMWLSICSLCGSVIIGQGLQGLIAASWSDRKWILASAVIMAALSIITLLMATECYQVFASLGDGYAKIFTITAKMYLAAAVAVAVVFFMARAKARLHLLRGMIVFSAIAVDIFLTAQFIVDKIL